MHVQPNCLSRVKVLFARIPSTAPMSMKWRAPEIEPARYRVVDIPWMPETPANRFVLLRIKGFLQPVGVIDMKLIVHTASAGIYPFGV